MAILSLSHSETKSQPHLHRQDFSVVREKSREMAGRDLGAARAAGATTNKGKIVEIAAVSVLAMLLLTASAVSMARYGVDLLCAFFLMIGVVIHVTIICFLAWVAATAPTPFVRRSYAGATVTTFVHLALQLYIVLEKYAKNCQGAA